MQSIFTKGSQMDGDVKNSPPESPCQSEEMSKMAGQCASLAARSQCSTILLVGLSQYFGSGPLQFIFRPELF